MLRMGKFKYPDLGMRDAIVITKDALGASADRRLDRSELGRLVGMDPNDERFAAVLDDLRAYGILGRDDEPLRFTDLALLLAEPENPQKHHEAITRAAFAIPIIRMLAHALLGRLPPEEESDSLVPLLADLTGTDIKEVARHADQITRVYEDAMGLVGAMRLPMATPDRPLVEPATPTQGDAQLNRDNAGSGSVVELRVGKLRQQYPLTAAGVELLIRQMGDTAFQNVLRAAAQEADASTDRTRR